MITTIVFSRDRAAQLDLCLRSLDLNAPSLSPVFVIYRATDAAYARAYAVCEREHEPVVFVREMDFESDVRAVLAAARDYVTFVMDDDVVYRPVDTLEPPPAVLLEDNPDVLCVSLRLGLNTDHCYPLDRPQGLPDFDEDGDALIWQWRKGDADFGYPGSLDAHVWRLDDLNEMLAAANWVNPNTLEDVLVHACPQLAAPLIACYRESRVVGVPVNRTSETHLGNRYGDTAYEPEVLLNAEYLDGKRLAIQSVLPDAVTAAHCEFPLTFAAA